MEGYVLVIIWVALLGPILWARRWWDRHSWPAWQALEQQRERVWEGLRASVQRRLTLVHTTARGARRARAARQVDEADVLLRASVVTIEALVPDLRGRLAEWLRLARTLRALAPPEPVRVSALRLKRLKGLVLAAGLGRLILTTSRERFTFHLRVLRAGLWIVLRAARGLPRAKTVSWTAFDGVSDDLGTLSRESVQAYRTLLVSLQARGRKERSAA